MQVCNYAGMQSHRYAVMHPCRYCNHAIIIYADMQVCGYAGMHVLRNAVMQVCTVSKQVCMYNVMYVSKYAGM